MLALAVFSALAAYALLALLSWRGRRDGAKLARDVEALAGELERASAEVEVQAEHDRALERALDRAGF